MAMERFRRGFSLAGEEQAAGRRVLEGLIVRQSSEAWATRKGEQVYRFTLFFSRYSTSLLKINPPPCHLLQILLTSYCSRNPFGKSLVFQFSLKFANILSSYFSFRRVCNALSLASMSLRKDHKTLLRSFPSQCCLFTLNGVVSSSSVLVSLLDSFTVISFFPCFSIVGYDTVISSRRIAASFLGLWRNFVLHFLGSLATQNGTNRHLSSRQILS